MVTSHFKYIHLKIVLIFHMLQGDDVYVVRKIQCVKAYMSLLFHYIVFVAVDYRRPNVILILYIKTGNVVLMTNIYLIH